MFKVQNVLAIVVLGTWKMKIAFAIQRKRIKKRIRKKTAMLDMMHSILSFFTKNRFLFCHQHFDLNWQTEIYQKHSHSDARGR